MGVMTLDPPLAMHHVVMKTTGEGYGPINAGIMDRVQQQDNKIWVEVGALLACKIMKLCKE